MTDQTDKPKLGTRPPLGLKRTVETGKVKQSFSHGRSNTVVVEVKKRRILGRPGEAEAPKVEEAPAPAPAPVAPGARTRGKAARAAGNARTRHDEKITVYISADELLALESARLTLRASHGVAADRGRIVREAISVLLADLAEQGEDSVLVRRLRG